MVKNLVSRSILNLLDQICVQKFFFHGFYLYYMLDFVASYHCMQLQGRLMNQTRENEEKKTPQFWDQFWPLQHKWISPILHVRHCCKLLLYVTSRKTNEPNLENSKKTQFWARFLPIWPNFGSTNFFFKNLALSVKYHGQLSSCKILKKTIDPILRKLSDGRTDRETGGQTDGEAISQDAV